MVSNIKTVAALVGALAGVALGHGHVTGIVADGVYYGGFSLDYYYEKVNTGSFTESVGWYAEDLDNGFISPSAYNTSDIVCHLNGQPANLTATVAAGGTLEFQWTDWPHPGPVLTYAALCPDDCTSPTLDKTALEWVKVDEAGYSTTAETWAAYDLVANNNSWTMTVPSTLASGNYVFRHEIIAVHGASSLDGAQNYPQCVNIAVTGGGSASPTGTLGEALYSETDAGIYFNPYTTITDYVIPGPALMDGAVEQTVTATDGSAAAATSAAATSTSVGAAATATTTSSSSSVEATPTSSTVEVVAAAAAATTSTASSAVASSAAPVVTADAESSSCKRRRHARDVAV